MKKYLLIGLIVLIGSNIAVLAGVAYNRMGNSTAQLTLTERELTFPYSSFSQKENSGISLRINWRVPVKKDADYNFYHPRKIKVTKEELLALGFEPKNIKDLFSAESKELYWAFEFNGEIYQAELEKALSKYQSVSVAYQKQPNKTNKRDKENYQKNYDREKLTKSRLFFIEANNNYQALQTKYTNRKNILIVKGLTKPYHDDDGYGLILQNLSIENIMVPTKYSDVFYGLKNLSRQDITPPRYDVDVKWGSQLQPWIINAERLAY